MTAHKTVECHECGIKKDIRAMYEVEIYWHPFDEKPETIYVCKNMPAKMKKHYKWTWRESCEELLDDSSWADFRFFHCEICERFICEQAPENGWHSQVRIINDCEQVCLKCYEEMLFTKGVDREDFESGKLPGMFFNAGDCDIHGFEKVDDFDWCHVRGTTDARRICDKALKLMDDGHICLVEYESMAIGGLEGYVTLWAKKITGD